MDITKHNFLECLPDIRHTINKAAFFTIDGEFTGLASDNNITPYDTPERFFIKTSENSKDFILIQLGLTAYYVRDEEPDKFYYRSYNFYVYPRSRKSTFKCQGHSIAFLAENGFDFNKLFRDGITYSTMAEAEKLRERMVEKQKIRALAFNKSETDKESPIHNHIPVTEENREWLEEVREKIETFLKSDDPELVLSNHNSFHRILIYQLIDKHFPNSVSKEFNKNKGGLVIERKKSIEEELKREEERIQNEQKELEQMIGITLVLTELSESKKLIVGHNMLLDVLYTLRQCFGQIPTDYKEFKNFTHSIFPNLIDTKYLCSIDKFKNDIHSTKLADLYETISKGPFKIPDFACDAPEYSYSLEDIKEHNAGFDSFFTGTCFLALTNYLNIKPKDLDAQTKILHNKKNKLFCLRLQDICYISLIGEEPRPSREHVFHVSFPTTWKQSDLVNHFHSFGSIFVSWINENEAFVALHNRENSSLVLKTIGFVEGVKIQTFADYSAHLNAIESNVIKIVTSPSTPVTPGVTKIKTPMSIITIPNSAVGKSLPNNRKRKISDTKMQSSGSGSFPLKKAFKDSDIWE